MGVQSLNNKSRDQNHFSEQTCHLNLNLRTNQAPRLFSASRTALKSERGEPIRIHRPARNSAAKSRSSLLGMLAMFCVLLLTGTLLGLATGFRSARCPRAATAHRCICIALSLDCSWPGAGLLVPGVCILS